MKPNLEINLFGPFEAASNGRILTGFDSDKVRALLAYLIVEAGSPQRREKLAGLFWPNFSERSARTNLRRALSNLRKVIGDREADPPFLFVTRQTVQFNRASSAVVDVLNFQELIQQNTSQASDSTHLEEALQLYRGDFLEGFSIPDSAAFETWQVTQREQYQGEAWGTLQRLVDLYIERDQRERATACARRLVAFDPFQESAQRQFMRLLAEGGRRNEALAQFEALNQLLSDELNVEPDPETTALYERIRSGELDREGRTAARDRVRGYELHELLGRGQFGAVYRATQTGVDRDVAIKVIAAQYADNPDFIRRFEVEAQFVARLEHPAIVPLYDYWREPGGAYLVMRWLRGGNLQTALADGRWDLPSAVRLVDQIAGALFTAHRQGIVHRDIKPANILLDEDQNAYLSDFGIAKDIYFDRGTIQEGRLVGSPGYLAPERIAQETVTPLTDIYSLGIMIYELLTGSHPFHDSEAGALIGRHLNDPLPTITDQRPDLPVAINEVIQRATAKDPAGRYPDAPSLAAAFSTAARVHETFEVSETAVAANPYKGLRAFRESDTEDFFGREALTVELLDRLRKNDGDGRFLAVVGPSGSGKSSVVRAGVVPALRQGLIAGSEAWFIAQMIPGGRPFEELEASLLRIAVNPPQSLLGQMEEDTRGVIRAVKRVLPGDDETELLLIVDQFEELFTLVEDGQQRQFFLDSLLEAVSDPRGRVRLILTLRADFYDRPLNYAGFGELVRRSTVAIVPLTGDELDMAIAAPAHNAGVFIEPELLATIKHDISHQPGALPLLQYALTELYERRRGKRMTLAAYHEMGGVMAALGRRAEEIYQCLDPAEQEASRQLFLRLVSVGEGAEDTRRRVLRSELQELGAGSRQRFGKAEIEAVIEAFGGHRLLTFDRDPATRAATVEVAHEALLREWERLRGWLEESWSDLIRHRQLRRAAAEWVDSSGEDESFLLRGERLARFERWAEETNLALSSDERAFLGASIVRRNVRQAAEQERQEKEALLEQRAGRRLRYLVLVVATALLVAMGLIVTTIFFAQEQRLTETLAEVSLARALFSESLANLETDPELSALLVLEAANRFQSLEQDLPPELELHMHQVAQAESVSQTFQTSGPMAMSPDGQLLAVGDAEGRLRLWNPLTGEDAWGVVRYQHRNRPIGAVALSPDGR
ncbi:MAG: protein kinase, partial [Candidatus Promineifilaceae bacterium]|nr:protein kinase [Candidatus Promineifilaceae bacterium]